MTKNNWYKNLLNIKRGEKILIFILILLVVWCFFLWKNINISEVRTVTKVVDGDTIELDNGETVRYIGINTPEISVPITPIECYGPEAAEKNKELVEGKRVKLLRDVKNRDKYGRILRYVYVDDVFVNIELVKEGYARSFIIYPNVSYSKIFENYEKEAKDEKRGLWAENKCNGGL